MAASSFEVANSKVEQAAEKVEAGNKSVKQQTSNLKNAKRRHEVIASADTNKNVDNRQHAVDAAVKGHTDALKEFDSAKAEVNQAEKAYHNAFGAGKVVPGHGKAAAAVEHAQAGASNVEKAVKHATANKDSTNAP
jgi:hypothetical protein